MQVFEEGQYTRRAPATAARRGSADRPTRSGSAGSPCWHCSRADRPCRDTSAKAAGSRSRRPPRTPARVARHHAGWRGGEDGGGDIGVGQLAIGQEGEDGDGSTPISVSSKSPEKDVPNSPPSTLAALTATTASNRNPPRIAQTVAARAISAGPVRPGPRLRTSLCPCGRGVLGDGVARSFGQAPRRRCPGG